ncbi:MAG: histidinol-phosphatase [Hyphomicrobiales bacterium]|nr:histidinol-phosphatase [Hyphomicrobiales bacterium]
MQHTDLSFMHALADASAEAILPLFRAGAGVHNKDTAGFDPVTDADRAAERAMRALIAERFPDDGVLGEEYGAANPGASRRWVLDPIDGTRAFIAGMPIWGTLIGLVEDGRPTLGMMNQPFTGERFWGAASGSRWRRDGREAALQTRRCDGLDAAVLVATTPDMFAAGEEAETFERISRAARLRRFGGDCYAYCLLAMGFVDVVMEANLKPYDILPLSPIIEGAGGVVTGWDGGPPASSRVLASGDPRLHDAVLRLINR